jgi:hypothetical protein
MYGGAQSVAIFAGFQWAAFTAWQIQPCYKARIPSLACLLELVIGLILLDENRTTPESCRGSFDSLASSRRFFGSNQTVLDALCVRRSRLIRKLASCTNPFNYRNRFGSVLGRI